MPILIRARSSPSLPATGNQVVVEELQAGANQPDGQERIRQEIAKGTIRILPDRGVGIRIVPMQVR